MFQFLEYSDHLYFAIRSDGVIERSNDITDVAVADDLTLRAARLLQQVSGVTAGVSIRLQKNLPIGGGLGGGSSDAATTLVALNHYWQTGLSVTELAELGLRLGADIPVFIHSQAAWAEGVGEKLTPLQLDEPWFLVIIPPCQVNTGRIFNDSELTRDSEPIKMRGSVSSIDGNDCEPVVFRRYPEVAEAARWLSQYASPRLTGTGACLFSAFADQSSAEQVLTCLPANMQGFISRACNQSPLRKRLQRATI